MNAESWENLAALSGFFGGVLLVGAIGAIVYQSCNNIYGVVTVCTQPYLVYSTPLMVFGVVSIAVGIVSLVQHGVEKRHEENLNYKQNEQNRSFLQSQPTRADSQAPVGASAFCGYCGKTMKSNLKFCTSCGKPRAL